MSRAIEPHRLDLGRVVPFVAMMETTDAWERDNLCSGGGLWRNRSFGWRVLHLTQVIPVTVIVVEGGADKSNEMPIIDTVEQRFVDDPRLTQSSNGGGRFGASHPSFVSRLTGWRC